MASTMPSTMQLMTTDRVLPVIDQDVAIEEQSAGVKIEYTDSQGVKCSFYVKPWAAQTVHNELQRAIDIVLKSTGIYTYQLPTKCSEISDIVIKRAIAKSTQPNKPEFSTGNRVC